MRRRPLRRAAVIGGVAAVAHHAGTSRLSAGRRAGSRPPICRRSRPPAARAAAPGVGGADMVAQLESLKKLLDEGVLTQAEFDTQKQKLLAGS